MNSQQENSMEARLKRLYFILLTPVIAGFFVTYIIKIFTRTGVATPSGMSLMAPVLFVLAISFGVAFPILWRTIFVNKNRNRKEITESELLRFEQITLCIAMVAPYASLIAFLFDIPQFHFYGTVLASRYAVYYFYPSQKRITYEKRIFRAK
ncbi:MAG: hypothetical protein DRH15_05975 [Deltaproteobacteria bacterium]|nr:MAG: hypothetical protein DRH15_05975 [Deltaproteobacteria bacterium]